MGLLPPWWVPVAGSAAAFSVLWPLGRRGVPAWPLASLAIAIVPWLPLPAAGASVMWAGPLTAWVWVSAAAAWLYAAAADRPAWLAARAALASPRQASLAAFLAAALVFGAAAWQLREARPGGDEPHYLVIVQSLLRDGDLRIENNHQRRDYAEFFGGAIGPHYLKRGTNGEIYSVHAPGLPAVVAPVFALGGYQAVVLALVLLSALGTVVAWRIAWLLTRQAGAAWFAWAASFGAPFFFHAYAVYPDALGSVLVATGVLALVRLEMALPMSSGRWVLHGAALAALPWLHTRFAVAAAVLGACIALRVARLRASGAAARTLAAFLAIPAISAVAWFGFFKAIWGTFSPTAPYGTYTQTSGWNILRGLPGLLLDQQFGILPNAPVYLCSLAGLWWLGRRRRRLALELSLLVLGYLAAVSAYHMWWGGWSAPARFAVPMMLTLGVAAGACWADAGRAGRAAAAALLGTSLLVTATLTLARGGRLIFNSRDGFARWLEYVAPNVDLARALPSFFRDGRPLAFAQAGAWLLVFALGVLALRLVARRASPRGEAARRAHLAIAVPALTALGIAAGATASWQLAGARPVSPLAGQLALLQAYDPSRLPIGVRCSGEGKGFSNAASVPPQLRLRMPAGRPAPPEGVLLALGTLPAGIYEVDPDSISTARGVATARLSRGDRAVAEWQLEDDGRGGPPVLELPAGAAGLVVEGDASAQASAASLALRPLLVIPPGDRVSSEPARRGALYGPAAVYTFDDHAWLESPGLWVRGGMVVPLVMADRRGRPSHPAGAPLQVRLRNGPVANRVEIDGGAWRADVRLAAREERTIDVPLRGTPPAALLRVKTDRGFRPSETTPGNGDGRYLGVWLEIPQGR